MPTYNWDTDTDTSFGVVHQSVANTDNSDDTVLKRGFDYQNFSEITPDPIAFWPLHEDSGTSGVADIAGSNNGSFGGTKGANGILGLDAYDFNGTSNEVTTGTANYGIMGGSNPFTITMWVNWNGDNNGNNDGLFEIFDNSNTLGVSNPPVGMFITPDGRFRTTIQNSNNNNIFTTYQTVNTNQWYFFGSRYDGSNLWNVVDGIVEDNLAAADIIDPGSDEAPVIGQFQRNQNRYFNGRIHNVRLYDQALTANELGTLYDVEGSVSDWTSTKKPL